MIWFHLPDPIYLILSHMQVLTYPPPPLPFSSTMKSQSECQEYRTNAKVTTWAPRYTKIVHHLLSLFITSE